MHKFENLKSSVASFIDDRSGNYALMFACVSTVLLMGAGLAVDYTRMLSTKTQMQDALDIALMSTTKDIAQGKIKESDAQAAVTRFFEVNLSAKRFDIAGTKIINFNFDPKTVKISAGVQTDLPLVFPVFGTGDTVKVGIRSAASYVERKVEVSMVLDVTGSMGEPDVATGFSKISELKLAAKAGVKEFITGSSGRTRVAIVPYSFGVNAGALKKFVVDEKGNPTTGDACATERRGPEMFTDASPFAGKITRSDTINYVDSAWQGTVALYCPDNAILPLTTDSSALNKTIDSLKAVGGTAGQIGLQWGRYMLSPDWKKALPAASAPAAYGAPHVDKFLILMTDGMFNSEASGLNSASVPAYSGISALSGRLAMTYCQSIKAQKIKIFTIGFRLKDIKTTAEQKEATRLLSDCASTPQAGEPTFFDADNGAELTAAFKEIAKRVEVVALTN
jgi:Flp pilus assembly protein TadG